MAGRESRDPSRASRPAHHQMRALAFAPIRRVLACNASQLGERCSEGKCPLSPLKPARSQPPFHPRSRMIVGCEHVPLAQHDRDVSPHSVTIKGFGGRSAPKRHNTPEAVDLARRSSLGTALRTCYPSRVSYADHPPCHPGLLGPTLHATGGTKKAAGMAARRARGRPEPVGRSVSPKPVSANPVRKERHLFIFAERATMRINGGAAHFPLAAEGECRCSRRRLPQLQHPGRTAPRVCPSGSRIGCLETTQARARASTRLWSSGTDRGQLGVVSQEVVHLV